MTDLLALYRGAQHEAFRLEAQQEYAVPAESAQYKAFREGRPIPPDPAVEESMQIIREAVGRGVHVHRVHVISLPLTPYLRYEMAAYAENIAAGEEVGIALRAWHRGLAGLHEDFVLFDPSTPAETVAWMRYSPEGQLAGCDYSTSWAEIVVARHLRDLALAHATPLREFTALPEAG